jgi:O-antigen/teichoic acid export membrane protein
MSSLTRNLLSSAAERVLSTVLTLVILPFQVRMLGMEAYGVLGFVASLQVLFNILDLGLGPTVIREMAADVTGRRSQTRALVQTLSAVYWSIALALGIALAGSAHWLGTRWLRSEELPVETIVMAMRLIAVSILLRWPVALYVGMIAGAQRLDVVNGIRVFVSLLKLVGGLLVLVTWQSLIPYLAWLAFAAFVEVCLYILTVRRLLPDLSLWARVSRSALRQIWRFSLHMNLLSLSAVLLVQGDRLVISRVLPIAELGFYSVAYSVVTGLAMLQSVVTTALFPALAHQMAAGHASAARERCRTAVQLLMYVTAGFACLVIFYGTPLLEVWISRETAARSAEPMAVLAFAFTLAASVAVPYTLSIAAGQTRVPLALNAVAAAVYIPAVYWLVQAWGIAGAAWAFVGLQGYYLLVLVPQLQRRIPMEPFLPWFFRNVFPFVGAGVTAIGGSRMIAGYFAANRMSQFGSMVAGALVYVAVAYLFLDSPLQNRLGHWWSRESELPEAPVG